MYKTDGIKCRADVVIAENTKDIGRLARKICGFKIDAIL